MKIYSAIEIDYNEIKILEVYKKKGGYFLNNFINYEIENGGLKDSDFIAANLDKIIGDEFYRVFNAGIGMILIAEAREAQEIVKFINNEVFYSGAKKFNSFNIGSIFSNKNHKGQPSVSIK